MKITIGIHPQASAIAIDQLLKWARQVEFPPEQEKPGEDEPAEHLQFTLPLGVTAANPAIAIVGGGTPLSGLTGGGGAGATGGGGGGAGATYTPPPGVTVPAGYVPPAMPGMIDTPEAMRALADRLPGISLPLPPAEAAPEVGADGKPKRVRRTKEQIAADKAAEAAQKAQTIAQTKEAVAQLQQEEFLPPGSLGIAFPPPPPGSYGVAPLTTQAPPPPAGDPMSSLPPPLTAASASITTPTPGASVNGHMSLEDFRSAVAEINKARQGMPMNLMRQPAFLDGTPHAAWWTIESVPPELRVHLVSDLQSQLMA